MRIRSLSITLAALCLPTLIARADEYSEFRIPEHRWKAVAANVMAGGSADEANNAMVQSHRGHLAGVLAADGRWGYDSDDLQHWFTLDARVDGERLHGTDAVRDTALLSRSGSARSTRESIAGSATWRMYPWRLPVGFQIDASVFIDVLQAWSSDHEHHAFPGSSGGSSSSEQTHFYHEGVSTSGTMGVGKVRDASGVYATELLEQRLRSTGALVRPLSPETRRKLAALYYVRDQFGYAHERPGKDYFRELEQILRDDGALAPVGLGGYDVLRLLEEPFPATGFIRQTGWFIGPTAMIAAARDREHTSEQRSAFEDIGDSLLFSNALASTHVYHARFDAIAVGAQLEYHRPIGPRWQADARSTSIYVDARHALSTASSAVLTWLVADRWYAGAAIAHQVSNVGTPGHETHPMWFTRTSAHLGFFVEDRWSIGGNVSQNQTRYPNRFDRNLDWSLGITRLLSGSLDVPGVIPPQRLSPP